MDRLHPEYVEAARYLYNRINYEKTSDRPYDHQHYRLARMEAILQALGSPQLAAPVIHVAGTKGKGSVSWQIAEVLRRSGYRVGLYTSPHLEHIEERFVVDGQITSPQTLASTIAGLREKLSNWDEENLGAPTFFELTTAIAWQIFRSAQTDVNVIEVGMGGRLDSTNVCQSLLSIITPISLDHQDQLGETVAKIAAEKAGIIKPNTFVVCGAKHPDASKVVRETALAKNCELISVDDDFTIQTAHRTFDFIPVRGSDGNTHLERWNNLQVRMLGVHQAENAAIAIAASQTLKRLGWKISETTIRETLACTQVPSRIEMIKESPIYILDAAHNVASMSALVKALERDLPPAPKTFVFASSKDKDYAAMLDILMPVADRLIVTQFGTNPRHLQVEVLEELVRDKAHRYPNLQRFTAPTIQDAVSYVSRVVRPEELVCFTGSFFITSEVRQALRHDQMTPAPLQASSFLVQ